MRIDLIADASVEPISLEMAWEHLHIDPDGDHGASPPESPPESAHDWWLMNVGIPAAREAAERFTGRCFAVKRYEARLNAFPSGNIELPFPPLDEVVSFVYDDVDGNEQTLIVDTDFTVQARQNSTLLRPVSAWPVSSGEDSVRIQYDTGFAPDALPHAARAGMLLLLGHMFKNREALTERPMTQMPLGVDFLLRPLRARLGMA